MDPHLVLVLLFAIGHYCVLILIFFVPLFRQIYQGDYVATPYGQAVVKQIILIHNRYNDYLVQVIDSGELKHLYAHQIRRLDPFEVFGPDFLMDGVEEAMEAAEDVQVVHVMEDGHPAAPVPPQAAAPEAASALEPEVVVAKFQALTVSKPKRFAKPKNRQDIEALADERQSKQTKQQTRWAVKMFRGN